MKEKKSIYTIYLIIVLVLQLILMSLTLAYAFWGKYENNQAANIWAMLWHKGLALFLVGSGVLSLISAIIGLLKKKDGMTQTVLSIFLILTLLPSMFCLILAIGSHF